VIQPVAIQPSPPSDSAGSVYLDLIQKQVDGEQRRKDSLEQRGMALVTLSGVMAGVVFALVTWATREGQPALAGGTRNLLVASVAGFFLGAVCGVIANRTFKYQEPDINDLRNL
jgi:hypothetical protein